MVGTGSIPGRVKADCKNWYSQLLVLTFSIERDRVKPPPCVVDKWQLDSTTKRSLCCFLAKTTRKAKMKLLISISLYSITDIPGLMSRRANSPTLASPFTVHFCVSQLGSQLWFMKRDQFPFGPASMIRY